MLGANWVVLSNSTKETIFSLYLLPYHHFNLRLMITSSTFLILVEFSLLQDGVGFALADTGKWILASWTTAVESIELPPLLI